jgi:hypothetical protein
MCIIIVGSIYLRLNSEVAMPYKRRQNSWLFITMIFPYHISAIETIIHRVHYQMLISLGAEYTRHFKFLLPKVMGCLRRYLKQ